MKRKFLLVGLTGGIGSGKSMVSRMFRDLGCLIVDADLLAREVVEPGEPAYAKIVAEFGKQVLDAEGQIDRKKLGALVFGDEARRKRLEGFTHPEIRQRQAAILAELITEGFEGIVIFDAALLVETGGAKNMDRLVVVYADEATQLRRLVLRDDVAEAEALQKIRSQMPLSLKVKEAHYVVDNSGAREETERRVREVHQALLARPPDPSSHPLVTTTGRRRALGQHFLRDAFIARRIVEIAGLTPADLCVEIGPGEGALTFLLAERAGRLLALELDEALAGKLRSRLIPLPHVEVRLADARSFDYSTLPALRPSPEGRVVVVGNLPYSVSKPILERLVEARAAVAEMVVTLQKEVAERVAADPGSKRYGALSVLTQLYCEIRLALTIPPGAFRPPPEVDSAVLHLRVLAAPRVPVRDGGSFHRFVKAAFSQRRKTLANALAGGLGVSVARARQWLQAAGIDPARRAETLSLEEFSRLNSFGPLNTDDKMKGLER